MSRHPEPESRVRALVRLAERVAAPIERALYSMVGWVKLGSSAGGADGVPSSSTDEDTLMRVEPYGLASSPPAGALGLVLAVGAEQEGRVVIVSVAPGGRPETASGDVALYTSAGNKVAVLEAGDVLIVAKAGSKILLGADTLTEPVAKATTARAELQKLVTAITGAVLVPNDGGAAIKAAVVAAFPGAVADFGSTTTEVK